jgi:hypothetical protein
VGPRPSGEIEQNNDELRLVVAVVLQAKIPKVWTGDGDLSVIDADLNTGQ